MSRPSLRRRAKFGAGDIEHAGVLRHFVGREILILVFEIDHHLERHLVTPISSSCFAKSSCAS